MPLSTANAYVIFDYFSPTDFKFAGIDVSTNKLLLGHRTAAGWIQDAFAPTQIKADTAYQMLVQVNGTAVTVSVGGRSFGYIFAARILDGQAVGLNKGLIGVGSEQARGSFDNVTIQVAPPAITFDSIEDYNDGVANLYTGATTGSWAVSSGRYLGTPGAGATTVATQDADLGIGRGLTTDSYLELTTTAKTTTTAGIVFDQYAANDFKFVAIDIASQRVIVGHMDPRRGWVVETSIAKALLANVDYQLTLTLKGASVAVMLNGSYVTTWGYNAAVVDGRFGLIARGAQASFDNTRIRTNDSAFAAPAGALTAEVEATSSESAPRLDEAALVPVVADAERAWIASGADPSAFDGMRIAVADLSGATLGQTVGKTIYIDATAAGYGWADVDLFEVIEHELGHVLGYTHEDADDHPVMRAILPVAAASAPLPITIFEATLAPARATAVATALRYVEATGMTLTASLARVETAGSAMPSAVQTERGRFERATPAAARLMLKLTTLLAPITMTRSATGGRVLGFDTYLSE